MMTKQCTWCYQFFASDNGQAKFCSRVCATEAKLERECLASKRKTGSSRAYKPAKPKAAKFEPWPCRIDMGEAGAVFGTVVSVAKDYEQSGELTAYVRLRSASAPDLFPADCLERLEVAEGWTS